MHISPLLNHFAFGETYEYVGLEKDTIFTFFFNWDSTVMLYKFRAAK